MFSQNIFSTRDVLVNSGFGDNNTWDSQQYSQLNSQNSQLSSSLELFSQKGQDRTIAGQDYSRSEQYQRLSQSQNTEDECPNYYSKYVKNPPLFNNGAGNNTQKTTQSIKNVIDERKQNVSIREERDLLQTFINLLKDYNKEVDSTFKSFKEYMTTSFEEIKTKIFDESKSYDKHFKNLKEELMSNIEKTEKEANEKQTLKIDLLEKTGAIKILESKVVILKKQLNEAQDNEVAHADQKIRYYELEQKYLQTVKNWENSLLGNTPPLSQQSDPLCSFLLPPLHDGVGSSSFQLHNTAPGNCNNHLLAGQVLPMPSTYGAVQFLDRSNPNPDTIDYYNLPVDTSIAFDSLFNVPLYHETSSNTMVPPAVASCSYQPATTMTTNSTSAILNHHEQTRQQQHNLNSQNAAARSGHANYKANDFNFHPLEPLVQPNPSSLVVSRRSRKRPNQSPIAMVKPQTRSCNNTRQDDDGDIFFCGVKTDERRTKTGKQYNGNGLELAVIDGSRKTTNKTPFRKTTTTQNTRIETPESNKEMSGFRQEESARRKRSLVSMLGTSSDDIELLEITKSIKAQQRRLVKRMKSLS